MEALKEPPLLQHFTLLSIPRSPFLNFPTQKLNFSRRFSSENRISIPPFSIASYIAPPSTCFPISRTTNVKTTAFSASRVVNSSYGCRCLPSKAADGSVNLDSVGVLLKGGLVLAAMVCGLLVVGCRSATALEGVVIPGLERSEVVFRNYWPKVMQVLMLFKEQGLILATLLSLSAFFSMAETSITTLWPWKVRELAEKESENGVFKMLRSDVTRFLTTILIGTTVVNIAATAIVTEAATAMFGEAGVTAATGVMTVAILLLTEITPKSVAVHNATEVARFVDEAPAIEALSVGSDSDQIAPKQKIRIKLRSYWVPLIEDSCKQIMDAAKNTNAKTMGPVPLPTKKRIYCVLKSPHVHKDARFHFEIRTHQRLIDILYPTAQTIDSLMQLDLPAGVDVEVKL